MNTFFRTMIFPDLKLCGRVRNYELGLDEVYVFREMLGWFLCGLVGFFISMGLYAVFKMNVLLAVMMLSFVAMIVCGVIAMGSFVITWNTRWDIYQEIKKNPEYTHPHEVVHAYLHFHDIDYKGMDQYRMYHAYLLLKEKDHD